MSNQEMTFFQSCKCCGEKGIGFRNGVCNSFACQPCNLCNEVPSKPSFIRLPIQNNTAITLGFVNSYYLNIPFDCPKIKGLSKSEVAKGTREAWGVIFRDIMRMVKRTEIPSEISEEDLRSFGTFTLKVFENDVEWIRLRLNALMQLPSFEGLWQVPSELTKPGDSEIVVVDENILIQHSMIALLLECINCDGNVKPARRDSESREEEEE